MQLVSDAYLLSQSGLSLQGSRGELQMVFSSDKAVTPRDEPNAEVRETITPGGGVARVARSTPVVLQPLGDPLVEDILPPETPDEDCLKMSLRNQDGEVAEVESKKPIEIITDPNDPLVVQWMKDHGTGGDPGYLFWGGRGRMIKRYDDADYEIFQGSWDNKMTHEQYLGFVERLRDCRYFNCRSRRAFCKKDGEPYIGTCMPYMPSLA